MSTVEVFDISQLGHWRGWSSCLYSDLCVAWEWSASGEVLGGMNGFGCGWMGKVCSACQGMSCIGNILYQTNWDCVMPHLCTGSCWVSEQSPGSDLYL